MINARNPAPAVGSMLIGLVLVMHGLCAHAQQIPPGMIMYTKNAACPAGWKDADQLEGVLAVPTYDVKQVGFRNGWSALGDREDRKHSHCCSVGLDLVSYHMSAASGPNYTGASAGHYQVDVQLNDAPSGLPFVQMKVCEKT